MRAIILDTETTGLDFKSGHRLVEIGCIELRNHCPTGLTYQQYINPMRDMPADAFKVHGISAEFLKDFPTFHETASAFLEFIADSPLIIHNAKFDMGFINGELCQLGLSEIAASRVICTLEMAKRKFPGAHATLDALCRRFGIDNSNRIKHGALLDSELLAEVYMELMGGRQVGFDLSNTVKNSNVSGQDQQHQSLSGRQPPVYKVCQTEQDLHQQFLNKLQNPLWHSL